MSVEGLDGLVRRMVQDEVRSILAERDQLTDIVRKSPFDMSDTELSMAERLLPEKDRPILRMRVMAYRMDVKGYHREATRDRRKADNLERQQNMGRKSA